MTFIAIAAGLQGCGFTPLYGDRPARPALEQTFAGIDVAPIDDRIGQQLRNRLIGHLSPRGLAPTPRYGLTVDLAEEIEGYGFRSDRAVTRERLRLSAVYRLVDLEEGALLVEETARANSFYDVVQSDFAAVVARRDARERASAQISDSIVARLALYFRHEAP